jgi:hypothetical protein
MGYNIVVKPLKYLDERAHKLEVMNDWTILFSTYLVMMFSNLVPQAEVRYSAGWLLLSV